MHFSSNLLEATMSMPMPTTNYGGDTIGFKQGPHPIGFQAVPYPMPQPAINQCPPQYPPTSYNLETNMEDGRQSIYNPLYAPSAPLIPPNGTDL